MLNPDTTLAIILGVSECPNAPKLQPLPQCANSAADLESYLHSTLGLRRANVINLFDSTAAASEQLAQIEDWLAKNATASSDAPATDLIVYYTGHGGFSRNDQSYFLAVNKTREGLEGATSIRYVDFASAIKRHADALRKYLILDCCFAAAAVVRTQADLSQVVIQRVEDELPPSGTAALCSSAAKLVSIAPPNERHTMFSGALLQCLREGVSMGPQALTLEDLGKAARTIIQDKYPNDSVRPELHVPEQTRGNPAKVPLFPNLLWKDQPPGEPATGIGATPFRAPEYRLAEALHLRSVRTTLGAFCGLLSALFCAFTWYPFGMSETRLGENSIAPFAPALFLALGAILVLSARSRITWKASGLILISTYFAWAIAWLTVFHSLRIAAEVKILINPALVASSGLAGFLGAFLLTMAFSAILGGKRSVDRQAARAAARTTIWFGLCGAITATPVVVFGVPLMSLTFLLGVFVPWQCWYVSTSVPSFVREDESPSRKEYLFWLVGAAAMVLLLAPRAIRNPVNQLTLPGPAAIALDIVSTKGAPKAKESQVTVVYSIFKAVSESLNCNLQLLSHGITYLSADAEADGFVSSFQTQRSTVFTVPTRNLETLQVRLACSGTYSEYTTPWRNLDLTATE